MAGSCIQRKGDTCRDERRRSSCFCWFVDDQKIRAGVEVSENSLLDQPSQNSARSGRDISIQVDIDEVQIGRKMQ